MSNPTAYITEINSLKKELKRSNAHVLRLRKQKRRAEDLLYDYMVKRELTEFGGVKISKIEPKNTVRKKKRDKKRDALDLFSKVGIDDPETFWDMFQTTQKVIVKKE